MSHTNIMVTVGLGPESTVVTGVIMNGNPVCHIVMNKQQVTDHIAVLQRHLDALHMMPSEQSAAIN